LIAFTKHKEVNRIDMAVNEELGPFWRRKISTWVKRFDTNDEGCITWNDFQKMIDRYIEYGNPSPSKAQQARDTFAKIWKQYFEEIAKVQKVTAEVYCDMLKNQGKASIDKTQRDFFGLVFDVIDTNQDNKVQKEEFIVFHKILGLYDEALATETYNKINVSGDGAMSREEFFAATKEFCVGNDEHTPFRFLFGPLI